MNNSKDPTNFSKKIVVLCIIFIILYTVVQLFISYQLGIELSPTLTTSVYLFFGSELASCALIRIFDKDKNQKPTNIDTYPEDETTESDG